MSIARYDLTEDCTTGKVDITPVPETMEGRYVSYEDYAALEARCEALAAENAGLNEKMDKLATWPGIEFYSSAWEFNNGDGNAALVFMCDSETPATYALLAEVRAQGVEQLASLAGNECQRYKSVNDRSGARKWKSIVILCTEFAAQLRKGVQS